jgi:hypothetical protein
MEETTKQQILRLIQSEKEARSKALSGQMGTKQAYGFIAGYTESILAQIEQLLTEP